MVGQLDFSVDDFVDVLVGPEVTKMVLSSPSSFGMAVSSMWVYLVPLLPSFVSSIRKRGQCYKMLQNTIKCYIAYIACLAA